MWNKNNLLGIKDLTRQEIEAVLGQTRSFKEVSLREVKKVPALRGRTVLNLFFENSTRTRTSFELAAKRLSADVINFSSAHSSLTKGESVVDTIKTLDCYHPDIMVIRSAYSASSYSFTRYTNAGIINAGDGANEHPTQALLDMFTVEEVKGTLENLNVLIVGDISHSRVARSNIFGFQKFSSPVTVCGPRVFMPYEVEKLGVSVRYNFEQAIEAADVIIMLRIQSERSDVSYSFSQREYIEKYSLTEARLAKAKKDCVVLHPGPVNWDIEISSALKHKLHPLILKQVENGMAVRMAVLYLVGVRGR